MLNTSNLIFRETLIIYAAVETRCTQHIQPLLAAGRRQEIYLRHDHRGRCHAEAPYEFMSVWPVHFRIIAENVGML
jgi:hypothetical protein